MNARMISMFTATARLLRRTLANIATPCSVNIEIIRAFIRLRRRELEHADLAKRIDELEGKYDASLKTVFDALRALMRPGTTPARPIGFRPERAAPRARARK